tara:strand:+ start:606 stop:1439 length:834 start_codon:yes stop_codon:yes gene_type:complete
MILAVFFLALTINLVSSVVVDADYVTIYPGEQENIRVNIENNEDFDIEDVSLTLNLDDVDFSSVGSSEKDVDDIDEDDDDSVSFTLRSSAGITPNDYDIPYTLTYINAENDSQDFEKEGSFGIRVSAKTELDFSVEVRDNAIVGREGRVSLEIINKGLGEIKSVSVKISQNGFELLSKDKIFLGTVDSDDTDIASFDVVYKSRNPTLSAIIEYKDFENIGQKETINLPFKVYTEEEAINLGLIEKSNTLLYSLVGGIVLIVWIIWRVIKKKRKNQRR